MNFIRFILVLTAALCSMSAVVNFAARMETDCYVNIVVAICALGGVVLIDYLEHEHNRRIAQTRRDVWRRREGLR